jgi:hypothetical protein
MDTSTTWKTYAVGFGVGIVSTALAAKGILIPAGILWGASLAYIGYKRIS